MTTEQLQNFGDTTVLAEPLDASETVITVVDGSIFPSVGNYRVVVDDEVMLVASRSTNDLTVTRGAEGTTAVTHADASGIKLVLTEDGLRAAIQQTALVAPTIASVGSASSGAGDINPVIGSAQVDDILLLFAQTANESMAEDSGYEYLGPFVGFGTAAAAGSTRLSVFWKRHDGSESDPLLADSGDHQLGFVIAIRGCVKTGRPFENVGTAFKRTASTTATAVAGTTRWHNCLIVNAFVTALDSTSPAFSSPANADLADLTEQADYATDTGTGGGICVITGVKETPGPFAATTATMTSGVDASSTFIMLPEGSRPLYDRQLFLTPNVTHSWYKPTGATEVFMAGIGGGGGGGSGRNAATASGGGAGGGGMYEEYLLGADVLPDVMSVFVGRGGAATTNADTQAGNPGTSTTITAVLPSGTEQILTAVLGNGGSQGINNSGGAGGNGGGRGGVSGGAGIGAFWNQPAGGGNASAGAGGPNHAWGGGAGAGGGLAQVSSAGGLAVRGGGGGGGGRSNTPFGVGGSSMNGQLPGGATVGASGTDSPLPWAFGGSGAAGGNGVTGPGGTAGYPGGGGGGGGSVSGSQRGGAGGDGIAIIITRC